jgi:predicted dehydrogenase
MDGLYSLESGCFSRDQTINAATGAAWDLDGSRVYRDFFEMLDAERGRIDAIVILTPVFGHATMIAASLEFGYRVISEKPLAASLNEVIYIQEALKRHPGFLAVTFNYTGYPMVRELRSRIGRGDLGRLVSIRLTMEQEGYLRRNDANEPMRPQAWRLEDREIPTVSLDLGTHVIHLLDFLSGGLPVRVASRMSSFGNFPQVIDDVDYMMHFDDGMYSHAWWSKSALGHANGLSVEVFGAEGSARWVQVDPEVLVLRDTGGSETLIHRGSRGCILAQDLRYNRFKSGHPSGFIEAFANIYFDIASAIQGGLNDTSSYEPYVFDLMNSLKVLRVLQAGTKSALSGAWESVPES